MPRLGIIGTMVWDRIYARDRRMEPVEEWGGIAYALAAAVAARREGWDLVPIVKIGRDLAERAGHFLHSLPGLDLDTGLRVVPEPNNRVELHYHEGARRTERLTGGVPPWRFEELEPILKRLDALYINFISGFELELETMVQVRMAFPGPIYADVHSLLLGVGAGGQRMYRPLDAWRDWLRCFDIVQVNEDELSWLAHAWGDPWHFAAEVVGDAPRLLLATLGPRGAAYVASPAFRPDPLTWRTGGTLAEPPVLGVPGAARSEKVAIVTEPREGDPTGCGDVWGATCFSLLLAGEPLEEAMRAANRAAARNVEHMGATGLHLHLQGRIDT